MSPLSTAWYALTWSLKQMNFTSSRSSSSSRLTIAWTVSMADPSGSPFSFLVENGR